MGALRSIRHASSGNRSPFGWPWTIARGLPDGVRRRRHAESLEALRVTRPEAVGLACTNFVKSHPDGKPSIGIILCKSKNKVVAEYALRDLSKAVGVSSYVTKLVESLPPALQGGLPSPEDLEAELRKGEKLGN